MSALTEDRNTLERVPQMRTPVAAAKIYAGALVALNADMAAVPAADIEGLNVIGVAQHPAEAGERINVKCGCYAFDGTGITNADIGKTVYAADDQTVAKATTNSIVAGTVFEVDDEGVWVVIGRTVQGA